MLKRKIVVPPEHMYPADEWRLIEARYSAEFADRIETCFSLGNGFVGIRGSLEEGRPAFAPGPSSTDSTRHGRSRIQRELPRTATWSP
jgi:alpha,alpha-trehalose phosphorylase